MIDKGSGDFVPTVAEDGKKNDTHSDDLINALINLPSIVHNEIEADESQIIATVKVLQLVLVVETIMI